MGLKNGWVRHQQVLGLGRHHLLTATTVGFLESAHQRQVVVGVDSPQVAGMQPSIGGEGISSSFRFVVVACRDARSFGQ